MEHGKVVWFSEGKGYGFIRPDNGGDDIFVHYTGIVSNAPRKSLEAEQRVEFEVGTGDKGPYATNVRVVT